MKITIGLLALGLALAGNAQVTVTTITTNGLKEPYNAAVDSIDNYYLSDSGNNRIVMWNTSTDGESTLAGVPTDPPGSNDGPSYAAHFNNPQGLLTVTYEGTNGLLVTDTGNSLIRFVRFSDGYVTTLAGATNAGPAVNAAGLSATFRYPEGLAQDGNGNVYIADWGNNTIRVMNLNDPVLGVTNLVLSGTSLNRPTAVAYEGTNQAGAGLLWISDTGNQMVKLITLSSATSGALTSALGAVGQTGTNDALLGASARFNGPGGLLWVENVGLLVCDTLNNSIRLATNNPVVGATTNYSVSTFAGSPGPANGALVDGGALSAQFNAPEGLALDTAGNGFLVADLKNNALRRIQNGPPLPPATSPVIGWVNFTLNSVGEWVSVLETNQPFLLDNVYTVAVLSPVGVETHFTFGPTPSNPLDNTIPDPSATVGSTAPYYQDGVTSNAVPPSIIAPAPDVTVEIIGIESGRPNSPITSARFQFVTASPIVIGANGASFSVLDATLGATIWYTFDGSDPTNGPPSSGPVLSGALLSIDASTNLIFKARAFCPDFAPSDVVSNYFLAQNFQPNKITFGFASGQASSAFVASPGQACCAPVTLTTVPNASVYSLQFNLTVTNAGANPGPAVAAGAYWFESMLVKPNLQAPGFFIGIPTAELLSTNLSAPPPPQVPASAVFVYNNSWFQNLAFTNTSLNLLGEGWDERAGKTNLYDTTAQDLIAYSLPHDTVFSPPQVVLGGYSFTVPGSAVAGQTYQIQIGRPSATSDGVGAPGSEVLIDAPASGPITAIKTVTIGQLRYIAGDSAPFRWFNAGDFGNTNLDSADVMQVFQSAIYYLNYPPPGSDFFDSMDSCGYTYTDSGNGYLVKNNQALTLNQLNALFDGDDTTINQIAFGDGVLDVCDVYVTFRRSLDPSLVWFQRFWTNGILAAQIVGNPPAPAVSQAIPLSLTAQHPRVNFSSADSIATPGQTINVPVTAEILGDYPLRVLMLCVTVNPLDGSPPLTAPVQFTPSATLGAPTLTTSQGLSSYAATWLDSTIDGLTGSANLGTLTFQVPTNATPNSAYVIHFDHASASPNGLASFAKQAVSGLVTLADRSTSSYNDGIPDSWRLRYFGTLSNILSMATADADGDGASNWDEYLAGTDPTDPNSCLRLSSVQPLAAPNSGCVVRWPGVAGVQYVIEAAPSLYGSNWMPLSTNAGFGGDLIFQDSPSAGARFYRVRLAQ